MAPWSSTQSCHHASSSIVLGIVPRFRSSRAHPRGRLPALTCYGLCPLFGTEFHYLELTVPGSPTARLPREQRTRPQTLAEKIWEQHVVRSAPGEADLLYIDLHLVHEVTSPQAFDGLRLTGRRVR